MAAFDAEASSSGFHYGAQPHLNIRDVLSRSRVAPSAPYMANDAHDFEVFFDGDCPLCRREIDLLRKLDSAEAVRFTDIADRDFSAASVGKTQQALMARIHGRTADGRWVEGVDVFRSLYSALGLGWAVPATRLPGVRQALDVGYRFFAKHRLRLTGREPSTPPEEPEGAAGLDMGVPD